MLLTSKRRAASVLLSALGLALLVALLPYASGLLGAPVLYILWQPVHARMSRRLPPRSAAVVILVLNLLVLVLPGTWLISLLVGEAQAAAEGLVRSPLLVRLEEIRVGPIAVGPAIARLGEALITWVGGNALSLLGTVTRFVLNLLFSFVGLYYLLISPGAAWRAVEPFVPLTPERTETLRHRFETVTYSTIVGTGLNAVVQGTLVGGAFGVLGMPNAAFWGTVTAVLSILPLVGSGLVWGPAALSLLISGEGAAGAGLILWGMLVVSSVDNLLRPFIYRRFAHIHPMITLVGAVVGVEYFGLIGLVLGPLAIQYFFELIRMFREEHIGWWWVDAGARIELVPPGAES
jgi:predicted PurR-regulated permease PerM